MATQVEEVLGFQPADLIDQRKFPVVSPMAAVAARAVCPTPCPDVLAFACPFPHPRPHPLPAVFSDIDDELDETVSKLKKELAKAASSNGISVASLDNPCEALKTKLNTEFHRNLDRFELYAYRNIFVVPGADASAGPGVSSDVAATTADLNQLRDKYNTTRARHGTPPNPSPFPLKAQLQPLP